VQNLQQLAKGDYDIAFSLADTAADAVTGNADFDKPEEISALTRIYDNYTHVIVRKDANIKSVEDFKGKTISTGSPKSGTEVIANRLIESAGLADGDVTKQRLDLAKTVDGMKDGTIDGMVWSGGLPTAGVTDLFTSNGGDVEFVDISGLESKMKELNPVYEVAEIPADTYKGAGTVKTIVTPNVLMVRNDMDEGTQCALTKLIYD
ncbi:TAXI family TRAP transporter solute-binding subunit, partial [Geobacillus sp. MMMUD3]|nr:TAXI family TRAP transporter solute-binding subunit [Geobacillus sp. MMMUD3]